MRLTIFLKMNDLRLREMAMEDCSFLNKLRNECIEFLHDSTIFSVEQTKTWFTTLKTPYYIILQNNEKVGYIRTSNYSLQNHTIYIGCDIVTEKRKQGIAYKSLSILIPKLHIDYKINKLYAEILSYNHASLNLYLKLGFKIENVKKYHTLKNGKYIDSIVTSLKIYENCLSH